LSHDGDPSQQNHGSQPYPVGSLLVGIKTKVGI
jgi:hypothetical protein